MRIFFTCLISLSLIVMPLRAGWATVTVQAADDNPYSNLVMDTGNAMQADVAANSDSDTTPPCCRDHCDGCNGNCDTCSPVNAVVPFIPMVQTTPDFLITQEVALLITSATPQPLLRPPPAIHC